MNNPTTTEKKFQLPIVLVSILIPIVVALLTQVKLSDFGFQVAPLYILPPIYATINGFTAAFLLVAVFAIKNGNRKLHERLMKLAIACSIAFLVMYVAYHMTSIDTKFGDVDHNGILSETELKKVGIWRLIYIIILLSHIALSIIIIPLVLITYVRALSQQFDKHKKLARITYPIWLYVAITGVIVYLMISPYYAK